MCVEERRTVVLFEVSAHYYYCHCICFWTPLSQESTPQLCLLIALILLILITYPGFFLNDACVFQKYLTYFNSFYLLCWKHFCRMFSFCFTWHVLISFLILCSHGTEEDGNMWMFWVGFEELQGWKYKNRSKGRTASLLSWHKQEYSRTYSGKSLNK